ncbi:hypothetical protein JOC55_005614 [Paenibacillus sacheonensis]|nr:hypothetical protein [Paenibacillus sacheonensis]
MQHSPASSKRTGNAAFIRFLETDGECSIRSLHRNRQGMQHSSVSAKRTGNAAFARFIETDRECSIRPLPRNEQGVQHSPVSSKRTGNAAFIPLPRNGQGMQHSTFPCRSSSTANQGESCRKCNKSCSIHLPKMRLLQEIQHFHRKQPDLGFFSLFSCTLYMKS